MDSYLVLLFVILPMIFGSLCTVGLQYVWQIIRRRASNGRGDPKLEKTIVVASPKSTGTSACHQRVVSTHDGEVPKYIHVSSSGKAHRSATCAGKNASKFVMCAKCFK